MKSKPLAVFSYSFPHRKTIDFLNMLHSRGFEDIAVVAAPRVFLGHGVNDYVGPTTEDICKRYGYSFIELMHTDKPAIERYLAETGATETAIISGARILKLEIIELFNDGIINFHPGEVPATSGLDSFYWMIKNNSTPGTTAHFIDHKVDAGNLISFTPAEFEARDCQNALKEKIYQSQLASLSDVLLKLKSGKRISRTPIFRPQKNEKITDEEKKIVMEKYQQWKSFIINNAMTT